MSLLAPRLPLRLRAERNLLASRAPSTQFAKDQICALVLPCIDARGGRIIPGRSNFFEKSCWSRSRPPAAVRGNLGAAFVLLLFDVFIGERSRVISLELAERGASTAAKW